MIESPALLLLMSLAVAVPSGAAAALFLLARQERGAAASSATPAIPQETVEQIEEGLVALQRRHAEDVDDRLFHLRGEVSEVAAILKDLSRAQTALDRNRRAAADAAGKAQERRLAELATRLDAIDARVDRLVSLVNEGVVAKGGSTDCAVCTASDRIVALVPSARGGA